MSASLALVVKRKGATLTYVSSAAEAMHVTRDLVTAQLTLTYDEEERRLPVTKRIGYHEAFRMLRRETGQRMAVINASAETGTIYGIEEIRAGQFTGRTLPLTYLIDLTLKREGPNDGKPLLVAIFAGEAHRAAVPVILVGVNGDRTMALHDMVPSVADFSTTVTNVLGAMVAAGAVRGLDFDPRQASRSDEAKARLVAFQQKRVIVKTIFELAQGAGEVEGYPREPLYRGVPRSVLTRGALGLSLTTLVGMVLLAAAAEWSRRSAVTEAVALEQGLAERRQQVHRRLLDRLSGLATKASLEPGALFAAAEALGQGGKVALTATLESAELALDIPHSRGDRRSALGRVDPEALIRALRTQPPPGWTRRAMDTLGDMNAWTLRFAGASLERDLLDLVGSGEPPSATPLGTGRPGEGRAAGGPRAVSFSGR